MKKNRLINSELSYVVAKLGHFDTVVVADAGLPIPSSVQRIDLALCKGVPSFMDTVQALFSEMEVQSVVLAEEFKAASPVLHSEFVAYVASLAASRNRDIPVLYVKHEDFKKGTETSAAVVRTGEFTPYANVILESGVVF